MKEKKKLKDRIKEKIALGENEVPACVRSQCFRFYYMGAAMLLIGLILCVLLRDPLLVILSLVLSLAIAGVGYRREYVVSHNGYYYIKGVCENIEYTTLSKATGNIGPDIPKAYLIRNEVFDNDLYSIPYYKQNPMVSEGDIVAVYFMKDVSFLEMRGAKTANHFLGYEVVYNPLKHVAEE